MVKPNSNNDAKKLVEERRKEEMRATEDRRRELIRMIRDENMKFSKQEALVKELEKRGIIATQSTVSRDLKLLGIGKYEGDVYVFAPHGMDHYKRADLSRILKEYADIDKGPRKVTTIALRTEPGFAQFVGKKIEELYGEQIFGSVADDDTLILAVEEENEELMLKLGNLMS